MESSQLKRLSIIGISVLCLSPLEIFSNKLFDNSKKNRNENISILASADIKLASNYYTNNYEIFNPNIKTTNEEIEKLVVTTKGNEVSDNIESNVESENKSEIIKEEKIENNEKGNIKETNNVVDNSNTSIKENSVSTKKENVVVKTEKKPTTNVVPEKKVEQPKQEDNSLPPNKETATSLVNYAKQFVGNPYKYGGTSLTSGVDCSGFTMKIYEKYGYSLPHSASRQSGYGTYVSVNNMQPGDLIFYGYDGDISHVAIYIGNSQIVHAATSTDGIKIANYRIMPIVTVRRILSSN